jgi:hypothetical protein
MILYRQVTRPICTPKSWSASLSIILNCFLWLYQVELVFIRQRKYKTLSRCVLEVLFRCTYLPLNRCIPSDLFVIICMHQQNRVGYIRTFFVKFLHLKIVLTCPVQQPKFFHLFVKHITQSLEFIATCHYLRLHEHKLTV